MQMFMPNDQTNISKLDSSQRAEHIVACIDPNQGSHFVFFRGEYRQLPIARVPADLLLYRAENGRLIMQIQEWEKNKGLQPGYFAVNQENPEIQEQLHGLLLEMAKNPRGPIYQELKRQAQQTDPLLITADGIVVNGNRRLAAMRALAAEKPEHYQKFQEVRSAVLPAEAQAEDIEYVEAALQLAPETKLAYTWINRRLKLRRQRYELGLPVSQILESYRLESESDLERELAELALAEDYLENILEQPGHYALVEDAEKLFIGLWANLHQLPEIDSHLWRLAGLVMILARGEIDADLSAYFPFTEPKPAHIPIRAMQRLAVEQDLISEKQLQEDPDLPQSVRKELAAVLSRTSEAVRLTRMFLDILDQLQIEHREQNAPKRLLKNLRQARQLLEGLRTEDRGQKTVDWGPRLSRKQQAQLQSELAAIITHSRDFLDMDVVQPLVGGYAERSKGLNPDQPSFTAGLAHAMRAILGRRLSRALGSLLGKKTVIGEK